jgi:hypothetical protein
MVEHQPPSRPIRGYAVRIETRAITEIKITKIKIADAKTVTARTVRMAAMVAIQETTNAAAKRMLPRWPQCRRA